MDSNELLGIPMDYHGLQLLRVTMDFQWQRRFPTLIEIPCINKERFPRGASSSRSSSSSSTPTTTATSTGTPHVTDKNSFDKNFGAYSRPSSTFSESPRGVLDPRSPPETG